MLTAPGDRITTFAQLFSRKSLHLNFYAPKNITSTHEDHVSEAGGAATRNSLTPLDEAVTASEARKRNNSVGLSLESKIYLRRYHISSHINIHANHST